jgi:tetratricopeptide (TPR) repeat protein
MNVNRQKKHATRRPTVQGMTKKHVIAFAVLSISIFLAYVNCINGTWAMDDIVANKPVSLTDMKDFIGFRKVAYVTFLLNQAIAPFSPATFRLFNIFIHIANAVLVYLLAYKTVLLKFENEQGKILPGKADQFYATAHKSAFAAAILSGVVFGLHPININAVAYIVQRMASLATFFVLLALLFYVFAAKSVGRPRAALLYCLSGACIIAGIFSKENAVMAIPLIILYDYVFLSGFKRSLFIKRALIICLVAIFTVGVATYFLRLYVPFMDLARYFLNPNQPLPGKGWMAADVYWTPLQHILTEFRVVSRYLMLILGPLPKLLVFDWWGFPVSTSITEPITTMLSAIFLLALLVFSIWKIKRFPLLCFGILWYLIAISLESFVALGSDLYFEHRNYLPVAGLFVGIGGQVAISVWKSGREKAVFASVLILGTVLGLLTFSRNFIWKDSITLWGDTLEKAPSNIRAMMALGNAYLKVSDMDNAKRYYQEAVQTSGKGRRLGYLDDSVYSLGMLYLFSGKSREAGDLIRRYEYSVESYRTKILKGFYKASGDDIDGALKEYDEVLHKAKGIDLVVLHTLMGDAYRKEGLWDEALEQYTKALSRDPAFAGAYYGMGVAFMSKRDVDRADEYFHKTLTIDPDNVLALSDMADLMLIKKENPQDALAYAERAISKNPPFYQPYLAMGNVLTVLGRDREAEDFYKKAVEHGMTDYMVAFSKARAYYMKGDAEKAQSQLAQLRRFKNLPEKIRSLLADKPG